MVGVPNLSNTDVEKLISNCTVVGSALRGGQKIVFPCIISGKKMAAKFILLTDNYKEIDSKEKEHIEELISRAKREILTMKQINSPYVVKLGAMLPCITFYSNQLILYYTEEWIEGTNLAYILAEKGKLPYKEVLKICLDITKAIEAIWSINKIHRDIKPANIALRSAAGEYVLLDFGVAFDLTDKSLTRGLYIVGTPIYFSPEQLNLVNKRSMDFRSDIFSLGVVAYFAMSGQHPFCDCRTSEEEIFYNIAKKEIIPLNELDSSIPKEVSDVIGRMLNKNANARYRKCSKLIEVINSLL